MVRENRGSGVIRPWITPIHQNVKLAVCSRVTVSNFLLHFLVKNVYFFFFFSGLIFCTCVGNNCVSTCRYCVSVSKVEFNFRLLILHSGKNL